MELLLFFISFALGIGILYLLFRATFYIKKRWGDFYGAIFVFAVVLLFFRGGNTAANNAGNYNPDLQKWEYTSKDSVTSNGNNAVYEPMQKTGISSYQMLIDYGISKAEQRKVPISITIMHTGWMGYTEWETSNIMLGDVDEKDKLEYTVGGTLKWKLLGFTVHSEKKSYHGFAALQ